jgi:protocatechuate 3,4-dioxygenase beta subunit
MPERCHQGMREIAAVVLLALAGCTGGEPAATPSTTKAACRPSEGRDEGPAAAPADTPSRVRLGPGRDVAATPETVTRSRRGTPLLVAGVVRAEDCTPLAGATMEVWQTDAEGLYGPAEQQCCYLQGLVRTDGKGEYTVDTVVPGRYQQTNAPPRHIHVAVSHPDARSVSTELMFTDAPPGERVEFTIVLGRR